MAHHTYARPTIRYPGSMEHDPCCPCPACGGLQCLCRPRFFAGQLLTEEDLNRLDHYIIEKQKLHNRYLHGWGVVCGLEVVCHPCENFVTVKSGYALGPCGEDIVVCEDMTVDVCALIKKCKEKERRECEPPRFGADDGCQDAEEDWVLTICYDEKPSRGITALRGSSEAPCCSRCSCGGSSACGCGCHEKANGATKAAYRPSLKRTPPQCEPTVICEGFTYGVFKAPPKDPDRDRDKDQCLLLTRFLECLRAIVKVVPSLPTNANPDQLHKWCCSLKANIQDFFVAHPTYDCQLSQKLAAVVCPVPSPNTNPQQYLTSIVNQLIPIVAEYLRYCFCSALLPPCPGSVCESCVILATITVRKRDCQIIRVCNWEVRKLAVTFPNLYYWLSCLPFLQDLLENLSEFLTKACCELLIKRDLNVGMTTGPRVSTFSNVGSTSVSKERSKELLTVVLNAWANRTKIVDTQTLAMGALGLTNTEGEPFMSEVELSHPLEFLMLNQLATPLLDNIIPDEVPDMLRTFMSDVSAERVKEEISRSEEINNLRAELKRLKETVGMQQNQINELSKKKK